jgi:hypothetical protein
MDNTETPPTQSERLKRAVRYAWLCYWVAFLGLFAFPHFIGREAMLFALLSVVACSFWLALATGRAASSVGRAGIVWGLGVVLLGPLGALLLPWAALSKPGAPK